MVRLGGGAVAFDSNQPKKEIMKTYEPLPLEITQNGGHKYRQVWRNERCAVYEQHGHYDQLLGYEAILIKHQEAKRVFGKDYPDKELYPTSEDWGKYGKTCDSIEEAKKAALNMVRANH